MIHLGSMVEHYLRCQNGVKDMKDQKKSSNKFQLLLQYFNKIGVKITDIHTDDGDLEDVFVELTKN